MATFVGLFLYTRHYESAPLRAVVHRRGAMRSETPDSPRRPFAWGLQPLCRGPLEKGVEPLDAFADDCGIQGVGVGAQPGSTNHGRQGEPLKRGSKAHGRRLSLRPGTSKC